MVFESVEILRDWDKWREAERGDRWARFRNPTADNPLVTEEWLRDERAEVDGISWEQE